MSVPLTNDQQDFYRVVAEPGGCEHCGHEKLWTIVHDENGEEVGEGSSWGDQEHAQDICDLMNMAYDRGQESQVDNAEEAKLVAFFRTPEGDKLGRDGDHDQLSPAETAIRAMRNIPALDQSHE
jgi:hypothetical protein